MTIREENRDLFTVPQGYYLAHCITADFSLGAGIAKKIDEVYNMKEKLDMSYDHNVYKLFVGRALLIDNVYNLVLKKKPNKKAKYKNLRKALEDMAENMKDNLITKVAMPKIGCGHEGLEWDKVKEIIEEVFGWTDVEILICSLDGGKDKENINVEDLF